MKKSYNNFINHKEFPKNTDESTLYHRAIAYEGYLLDIFDYDYRDFLQSSLYYGFTDHLKEKYGKK